VQKVFELVQFAESGTGAASPLLMSALARGSMPFMFDLRQVLKGCFEAFFYIFICNGKV